MSEIENLKIDGGSTYTVGNQDIIANEWEAGKTYVKGKSYVIREHRLYVCNVTHTSVEPFDPDNWTEITVGDAIAANTTAVGDLSTLTTTDKSSIVGAVNEAVDTKNLYSKSTYQNDVGQTITLSETTANFRFIRLSVYINDTSYSNAGMLLVANCKSNIQVQHFPLCINAVLGSVRIDLSGTSLKLYSTSFGSTMFITRVDGIY